MDPRGPSEADQSAQEKQAALAAHFLQRSYSTSPFQLDQLGCFSPSAEPPKAANVRKGKICSWAWSLDGERNRNMKSRTKQLLI